MFVLEINECTFSGACGGVCEDVFSVAVQLEEGVFDGAGLHGEHGIEDDGGLGDALLLESLSQSG